MGNFKIFEAKIRQDENPIVRIRKMKKIISDLEKSVKKTKGVERVSSEIKMIKNRLDERCYVNFYYGNENFFFLTGMPELIEPGKKFVLYFSGDKRRTPPGLPEFIQQFNKIPDPGDIEIALKTYVGEKSF